MKNGNEKDAASAYKTTFAFFSFLKIIIKEL